MTIFQAVILGAVQGLTEFLPVSSSGHLVLLQHWLGLHDMLVFDIAVHWGTLLAALVYFWRELLGVVCQSVLFLVRRPQGTERDQFLSENPYALTGGLILLSSAATAIVGIFFKELFQYLFESVLAVGIAWVCMAFFLICSKHFKNVEYERGLREMNHQDAFLTGLAQGIALIPGISRSGSTILAGMKCGLERKTAAHYSFLMAVPAIFGVGLYKLQDGMAFLKMQPEIYAAGFLTSAVVGFCAIALLFRILERGKYHYFGYYCLALGLFAIASQYLLKP